MIDFRSTSDLAAARSGDIPVADHRCAGGAHYISGTALVRTGKRCDALPWPLEYFDALLIGLTATPSKQTIGFFNQNLVMEYNHERAVTGQGGKVEQGFYADRRTA